MTENTRKKLWHIELSQWCHLNSFVVLQCDPDVDPKDLTHELYLESDDWNQDDVPSNEGDHIVIGEVTPEEAEKAGCVRFETYNEHGGVCPINEHTPEPAKPAPLVVKTSAFVKDVDYDTDPDDSYMHQEGFEDELAAAQRGDITAYYCQARVEIVIPHDFDIPEKGGGICHTVSSPGLYGIWAKSDDDPYFDEIFEEESRQLIHMLRAMGITVIEDSEEEETP